MRTLLALGVFVIALSQAHAQSLGQCALKFSGATVLRDAHHVGYVLEVKNPTRKPIDFRVRLDFIYEGKKIEGGFEYEEGIIPAKGKRVFKGSEPFVDPLVGVDTLRVQLKKCDQ